MDNAKVGERVRVLVIPHDASKPYECTIGTKSALVKDVVEGSTYQQVFVDEWFPSGALHMRLSSLPGSNVPLPHVYGVYVDNLLASPALNTTASNLFGVKWKGNIVIVKYGKARPGTAIHVAGGEAHHILLYVGL